jgi:hypothetical protein
MATCLPTLTRLRSLSISIGFEPRVLTSRDPPPSSSTIILPALTNIELDGPYGCLEDLVARIEAPLLNSGDLRSCDEPTYVTPRLFNFIHRTEMFKFPDLISVYLRHKGAFFDLRSSVDSTEFSLSFPFHESHTPVELLERLVTQCLGLFSRVERLDISGYDLYFGWWWQNLSASWLGFLRPFTAVQTLRLVGHDLMPHLARMLGNLTEERVAEVLPALHTTLLWGSPRDKKASEKALLFKPFIVAREHSEHPVVVEYV